MTAEEFLELRAHVLAKSPLHGSYDHGERHWRAVAHTGAELCRAVPEADPLVVLLFALFHDSRRENEFHDPEHGLRGADLARRLLQGKLDLEQMEKLYTACRDHTGAPRTDDPTIGVCLDANRLNLWRVHITPDPRFLSTAPARDPEMIRRGRGFHDRNYKWEDIAREALPT